MFALTLLRRDPPALKGERIFLRAPRHGDFQEWATLRRDSRNFLEPWEPRWAHNELERSGWRYRLQRYRRDFAAGTGFVYLIFETETGRLLGGISISNIRYGVSQSAQIGYWMGEPFAGHGFMQDAVRIILTHAFQTMRLHRIEAACIPSNIRSIRVLEKTGFRREGLLRSYLRINGVWHDHYIYAQISGGTKG